MKVICKRNFSVFKKNMQYKYYTYVDWDDNTGYYVFYDNQYSGGIYLDYEEFHNFFVDVILERKQKIQKIKERLCLKSVTK